MEEAGSENEESPVIWIKRTRSYIVDSDTDWIGFFLYFELLQNWKKFQYYKQ